MKFLATTVALVLTLASFEVRAQECKHLLDSLSKMVDQGNFQIAELIQMADSVCLHEVGERDSLYGDLLVAQSVVHFITGTYKDALPLLEKAKSNCLRTRGYYSLSMGSIFSNIGFAYTGMGLFQEALTAFDTSLMLKTQLRDTSFYVGQDLLNRAIVLINMGRFADARKDLEASIQNAKDNELDTDNYQYLSRINALGVVLTYMGETKEAIPVLEETVRISVALFGEENQTTIACMSNLAQSYLSLKELRAAEKYGLRAFQLAEKIIPDHPETNKARQNLGIIFLEEGRYSEALPLLLEAKAIEDRHPQLEPVTYSQILNNIGNVYIAISDFAAALPYLSQSRELMIRFLGKHNPRYAMVINNLATCHYYMGNSSIAQALASEAFVLIDSLGEQLPNYELVLSNLASAGKESNETLQKMRIAKDIAATKFGEHSRAYGHHLTNYASMMANLGRRQQALPLLEQAEKILSSTVKPEHRDYVDVLRNLAGCHEKLGHSQKAYEIYARCLELTKAHLGSHSTFYAFVLTAIADLEADQHNYREALSKYLIADSLYHSLIYNNFAVLADAGREAFLESIRPEMNRWRDFAPRHVDQFPEIPGVLYNHELVEKGQLLQSASGVLEALHNAEDPSLASRFEHWRGQKQMLEYQISLPQETRLFSQYQLDSIRFEAELNETSLVQGSPAFSAARNLIRWEAVRDHLNQDEAAIEFTHFKKEGLESDNDMYAALILRPEYSSPKLLLLFDESQLLAHLNAASTASNINERIGMTYRGHIETALYQLVWKPLEPYLKGAQKVYYAPTGLLHRISFPAISEITGKPLLSRYDLHHLGSTREIVLSQSNMSIAEVDDVMLYGGVNYVADSLCLANVTSRTDTVETNAFQNVSVVMEYRGGCEQGPIAYLPGTKIETDRLASFLGSHASVQVLQGCSAREEGIKSLGKDSSSPDIVHIATHGFFCDEVDTSNSITLPPLFRSGLLLAGAQRVREGGKAFTGMEDGILYAYEVANLNLIGTKLVVLSACETALGEIRDGEGVYGLARSFLLAGAQHVIMSLWQISDDKTVRFMELFYQHWFSGMEIQKAFRKTQLDLQKEGFGEEAWGAFVLI